MDVTSFCKRRKSAACIRLLLTLPILWNRQIPLFWPFKNGQASASGSTYFQKSFLCSECVSNLGARVFATQVLEFLPRDSGITFRFSSIDYRTLVYRPHKTKTKSIFLSQRPTSFPLWAFLLCCLFLAALAASSKWNQHRHEMIVLENSHCTAALPGWSISGAISVRLVWFTKSKKKTKKENSSLMHIGLVGRWLGGVFTLTLVYLFWVKALH